MRRKPCLLVMDSEVGQKRQPVRGKAGKCHRMLSLFSQREAIPRALTGVFLRYCQLSLYTTTVTTLCQSSSSPGLALFSMRVACPSITVCCHTGSNTHIPTPAEQPSDDVVFGVRQQGHLHAFGRLLLIDQRSAAMTHVPMTQRRDQTRPA
jgi:hypothetical protein